MKLDTNNIPKVIRLSQSPVQFPWCSLSIMLSFNSSLCSIHHNASGTTTFLWSTHSIVTTRPFSLPHGFNFLVYSGWWLVFLFLGLYQY
jgi:hypothetical protein